MQPVVPAKLRGESVEHLQSGLRALDVQLDADALAKLDEIFPGHKPAPEDYAW